MDIIESPLADGAEQQDQQEPSEHQQAFTPIGQFHSYT